MEKLRCLVMDLSLRVTKAQDNVEVVKVMMRDFQSSALYTRNDEHKQEGLLNIKGKEGIMI